MTDLETCRAKLDTLRSKRQSALDRVKTERSALEAVSARCVALQEAQSIAQLVAERIQTQAHKRIAEIVTSCLALFEDPYEFKILFKRARGKTEAHLLFERDGVTVDPLTASGGGVVDVASFALRLACLILRRPPLRRLIVADEPFRFVSKEYRPLVRKMLVRLAKELGVQFVVVTHDPQMQAGKVVDLSERAE